MKIAVLGAGITGLSAAYRLTCLRNEGLLPPNARLSVYEERNRTGGVLATLHRDGFQIEQSADNFITTVPWGLDLCRALGLGQQVVQTDPRFRRTYVVHRRRLCLLPDGFLMLAPTKLWPLALTPILSPLGKLRAAMELIIPACKHDEDESMARFVRRRLGREVFERLVEPLVSGVYAADMEKLSVLATLPRFRDMERRHGSLIWAMRKQLRENRSAHLQEQSGARYSMFVTLTEGLSSLCDALAARLPPESIRLNCRITGIEKIEKHDDEGKSSGWLVEDAHGEKKYFDAIISALPAHETARLFKNALPKIAALLAPIEHQGTAIATFAFDSDRIGQSLTGMGFVVPKIANSPILAGSFSSLKYAHRAPPGKTLIRVFAGGARSPEMVEMPEDRLVPLLLSELKKVVRIDGEAIFSTVAYWPRTMPQYHVGHRERIAVLENEVAHLPGFEMAGNFFHGVGLPNCAKSGMDAADRLVEEVLSRMKVASSHQ